MKIRFYKDFFKRSNSTKVPSDSNTYIEYEGSMKSATSLNTPIMSIDTEGQQPYTYKYCEIVDFGKFYFIQDVVSRTRTIWDYYLTEDCLATFRESILNSYQFVVRATKPNAKYTIPDNLITMSTNYTYNLVKLSGFIDTSKIIDGCFCLGITKDGAESGSFVAGSVSYYIIDANSLNTFINDLISLNLTGTSGLSNMATFSAVNPIQYIVSCVWLPFKASKIAGQTGGSLETIGVLDWKSNTRGYRVSNTAIYSDRIRTMTTNIPKHPQRAELGSWIDQQASQYCITVRGYGQIALDPIIMGQSNAVVADQYIDVTSGASVLKLYGKVGDYYNFMSQANAQIGISMQLSQIQKDVFATATINGTSVPIGVVDAYGGTQAITNAISAIGSAADKAYSSFQESASTVGNAINQMDWSGKSGVHDTRKYNTVQEPFGWVKDSKTSQSGGMHSRGGKITASGAYRSGNDRVTTFSDAAAAINQGLTSWMHNFGVTSASVGSTGTFASIAGIDELYCYFQLYADYNPALNGRPSCTNGILKNYIDTDVNGVKYESFVQCMNPSVQVGNTFENSKIISYLSGGCYII